MARITIEDCMEHVPNRFQLVRMASIRAKQLKKGARPLLTSEENKEVVMSLREIAAGLVKPSEVAVVEETSLEDAGVDQGSLVAAAESTESAKAGNAAGSDTSESDEAKTEA